MNITRRHLLSATVSCAPLAAYSVYHNRHLFLSDKIGNKNGIDAVLGSLRETVYPKLRRTDIRDFVAYMRREHSWVFHPLTAKDVFARTLCTQFILNSNLPETGFDFGRYSFYEFGDVCSPFHVFE